MIALSGLTLAGCSEDQKKGGGGGGVNCDDGQPVDEFTANMRRTTVGGLYEVTLVSASPAPPDVGFNHWVLQVDSDDAELRAHPWMPMHGHGASNQSIFEGVEQDDGFLLHDMDLYMAGLWEVTVEVDGARGADEVVFRFCLEG